jgi:hypothetical protein
VRLLLRGPGPGLDRVREPPLNEWVRWRLLDYRVHDLDLDHVLASHHDFRGLGLGLERGQLLGQRLRRERRPCCQTEIRFHCHSEEH